MTLHCTCACYFSSTTHPLLISAPGKRKKVRPNGGTVTAMVNRSNFEQVLATGKARTPRENTYEDFQAGVASTAVTMYGAAGDYMDYEAAGMEAYASRSGGGGGSDAAGGASIRTRGVNRNCGFGACEDFFRFGCKENEHRKRCREFPDPLFLCLCLVAMSDTSGAVRPAELCTQQGVRGGTEAQRAGGRAAGATAACLVFAWCRV